MGVKRWTHGIHTPSRAGGVGSSLPPSGVPSSDPQEPSRCGLLTGGKKLTTTAGAGRSPRLRSQPRVGLYVVVEPRWHYLPAVDGPGFGPRVTDAEAVPSGRILARRAVTPWSGPRRRPRPCVVGVGPGVNDAPRVRKPASQRRAEIMEAAGAEFAANGLAGARLEAIAARVGVSHPRVVQMFGSKRSLFVEVVHAAFDRIDATFAEAEPTLSALGDAFRRLLRGEHTVGLVMLQAYAAAVDGSVRDEVRRRQLELQASAATSSGRSPTGATAATRSPTAPPAWSSTEAATWPPAPSPSSGRMTAVPT